MASSLHSARRVVLRRALTPHHLLCAERSRNICTMSSFPASMKPLHMSVFPAAPLRYIDPSSSVVSAHSAFTFSHLPVLSRLQQPLAASLASPSLFTITASLPPLPATSEDTSPIPFPSLPSLDCPPAEDEVVPLSCHLTYNPNVLKRKRTHGFLARKNKKSGRRVLMRRLGKGRKRMAA
jgi:ribosomal protein L34